MDTINNYFHEVKDSFLKSPIRQRLCYSEPIPYKNLVVNKLNNILEDLKGLESNKDTQLKVVIVGEVKSGKSSLLNAIVGKEVSQTDVLESTASIIEVVHETNNDKDEIDNVVVIKSDNDILRDISIVDTPGVRSITVKNEQQTLDYIKNADLILFVIDATHLGQEDVIEALDTISKYKKNIVGIINKYDLIEKNKEDIIEYVDSEYGIYIDDFFFISSYLEYQANMSKGAIASNTDIIISNYTDLKENFKNLMKYIEKVRSNNKNMKIESIKNTLDSLIEKDLVNHLEYKQIILVLMEELKNFDKLLQNKYDYVNAKMEFEINDWSKRVFLFEELNKINEDISYASNYINESYINEVINKKKIELDEIFFHEWSECLKEISEQLDSDIKKYIDEIKYENELLQEPTVQIDYEKSNINEILASVGTGAILGVTSGSIISLYTSIFGSSATSTTIGTAMMAYCPPFLIAGTVSGAIAKVIYDKIKMDNKSKEIINDIDNFISNLRYQVIECLNKSYNRASQEIVITTTEILKNLKGIYNNKYDIEILLKELDEYLDSLNKYIKI